MTTEPMTIQATILGEPAVGPLDGADALPGVPMVDVRDETGRVIETGYYVRHVNRTPYAFDDCERPEDVEHLVVADGFSDWGLPRGIYVIKVNPPYTIEIHEEG